MAKWINKNGDMIVTNNATYTIINKDGSGHSCDISKWSDSATSWIMNDIKSGYYQGYKKVEEAN